MKKLFLSLLCFLFILTGCIADYKTSDIDILTLFSSMPKSENSAWVGTFQLVFNDMKNNIFKKDIEFINEKPTKDLKGLNNEEFNSTMLNENSYFKSYGKTSPSEKNKIIKGLKEKFNEKSKIIDDLDWSEGIGRYYAYAMIKKQFEFLKPFDKLEDDSFNNSEKKFEFFGIGKYSDFKLKNNVEVLFYNNENDYAVKLLTKTNDTLILYRTDENNSFLKLYQKMLFDTKKYNGTKHLQKEDTLKVPYLKFSAVKKYTELCNKQIKGTDLYFSDAIETLEFEMDEKGAKVKSEAAIMTDNEMIIEDIRHFDFNKTFNIFAIDVDKNDPYLAIRIKDLDKFIVGK